MMKSRQTVAQQSHRRGIAFGARPHRAKRSLSLLAKVKQTTRRFRLIFEVGAADPFLQIEIEKEQRSRRRWSTVTDCYRSRYRPFSLVGGTAQSAPFRSFSLVERTRWLDVYRRALVAYACVVAGIGLHAGPDSELQSRRMRMIPAEANWIVAASPNDQT